MAPHEAIPSELHTSSLICAGCHEYRNEHGVDVLSNYSEWKAGPFAQRNVSCQGCHMEIYKARLVAGQQTERVSRTFINLHVVPGGHFTSQLRRAVDAEIVEIRTSREGTTVHIEISNTGSGHRVPGGLSNRHIRLEVRVGQGARMETQERLYQRILTDGTGAKIEEVSRLYTDATAVRSDSRLAPGEVRKERFIFSPAMKGAELVARLIYVVEPV